MPTSSITKNFIVSGKEQVETFANAIEESYLESRAKQNSGPSVKYRELKDTAEIQELMARFNLRHNVS